MHLFFQGLATLGERLCQQGLGTAMLGGGQQLACALVTVFHQRGNRSQHLGLVRFNGLQRIVRVLELRIGRGQVIELVGEICGLVIEFLHLRLHLGQTGAACSNLRFEKCMALFGIEPLGFVQLARVLGLPVNVSEFCQCFLLLGGEGGFRIGLLGVQRRDLLLCGEMLLLQFGQLSTNGLHALLGGTGVGLMGLLSAKQGANGGIEHAALIFHLPQGLGHGIEAVLVATQFVHTCRDGFFLATQLCDLRLCVLHLLLGFGQ